MDLKGIRYEGEEWIHLAQDRDQWPALFSLGLPGIFRVSTYYFINT
jgi:hypothetical protein